MHFVLRDALPSAFAILADSAIMAIENATLRRSSGSPAKNVRTASMTSPTPKPELEMRETNSPMRSQIDMAVL